ncbi:MAG: hypothetical protein JO038_00960 [Alphaproteobacteria bacterium]|nr:hypothetical protein [Alphaproteobacteria bacterium]
MQVVADISRAAAEAGKVVRHDDLAGSDPQQELEDLLAYDWQDSRTAFFHRVRALYDRVAGDAAVRDRMAARVLEIAGRVRPSLQHPKLWPLAFLLGQDAHLISVEPDFGGHAIFLYRGSFHAVPAGSAIAAELVDGRSPSELISAPGLEELHARLLAKSADPSAGPRVSAGANGAGSPDRKLDLTGPDIPWISGSGPEMIGFHLDYNILLYVDRFWALPQALGPVDLTRPAERSHPAILIAETRQELMAMIDSHVGGEKTL